MEKENYMNTATTTANGFRMGRKGDRFRMVIARFLRYADRERIMRMLSNRKELRHYDL